MANYQKIQSAIDDTIRSLTALRASFGEQGVTEPATPKNEAEATSVSALHTDIAEFDGLKKALESSKWPEAVNPNLICDRSSEQDKVERAVGIIELMVEQNLTGKKYLDFGCGEGHTVAEAAKHGTALAIGYDRERNETWDRLGGENVSFTDKWVEVEAAGPYDAVVLFDVIDHTIGESPVQILEKVKSVLAPDGLIYLRTHPYTSRHGTHLYHKLNKAYLHLVFTEEELATLVPDYVTEANAKVTLPMAQYAAVFTEAGLTQVSKRDITERVEAFFKIPKIAERIMRKTGHKTFPEFQMSLQFIDYVLKA